MPIPPRPHAYRCPACGWSKTVVPRSDVLMRGIDHFDACPVCSHRPLETQAAGVARTVLAGLAEQIAQLDSCESRNDPYNQASWHWMSDGSDMMKINLSTGGFERKKSGNKSTHLKKRTLRHINKAKSFIHQDGHLCFFQ